MRLPVFISGPESSGKTTLSEELASHYHGTCIREYARSYISGLNRPYVYEDVEHVAHVQLQQIADQKKNYPVFFDTGLIITKIWFLEVYGKIPTWFSAKIPKAGRGIYLLCQPDLPWETDPVRENPDKRDYLYALYKNEICSYGFHLHCIQGTGEERFDSAINYLSQWINV